MAGLQLHSVSFAEFDIDVGNTLTHRYPQFKLDEYDDEYLGNCCLPDGGHIHSEDRTFLILHIKKKIKTKVKDKKKRRKDSKKDEPQTESQGDDESVEVEEILYGVSFFMSRHDKTVKRGAIQKSILLLSSQPHFELFYHPAKATLERYLDDKSGKEGKQLLKTLFDSINLMGKTQNFQLNLWGATYPINVPVLGEDQFEGVSLVELINRFQVDTILLWYSILLQRKILFVGQPARDVGNCALVTPLLVAPLTGFTKIITPYVALTDITPVLRPTYICGTTNLLFESKTDWWDTLASFSSGSVITNNNIKVASADKEFMKNVISGIQDNKGEQWVRQQFNLHTIKFLIELEKNNLKKEHKKYFANFKENTIYKRYKLSLLEKNETESDKRTPFQVFQELKNGLKDNGEAGPSLSKVQQTKMLYELSNCLQDLTHIEEICDAEGVSVMGMFLNEQSVQMRKYAVVVLAQLALSLKGQIMISMMSDQVLTRVIEMLKDNMPNVANAAGCCLLKISTLYCGVQTLVSYGVHTLLLDLICNGNLDLVMKTQCMATLLQIYRFAPDTPKPNGNSLHAQLKSPDKKYKSTVLQLLDLWNEELPAVIAITPKVEAHIKALQANMEDSEQGIIPDLETRITSSTFFLSDLVKTTEIIYEFVEAGGVEVITENLKINDPNQRLPKYSYSILTILADSNHGRKRILKYQFLIENAINSLENIKKPLLAFGFVRFLEVCSQHKDTSNFILEKNGLAPLLSFLLRSFMTKQRLLCIPVIAILRQLTFFFPQVIPEISKSEAMAIFVDIVKDKTDPLEDETSGLKKLKELSYSILVFVSENPIKDNN